MSEPNQKCHNCQTNLGNKWLRNTEKGYNICYSCLEELDRKGELWDNFFMFCWAGKEGMEGGKLCNFCHKPLQESQKHYWKSKNKTIKHKCLVECCPYMGSKCRNKQFELTQKYVDLLCKYENAEFEECPDCKIQEVKKDVKNHDLYNQEKQKKDKEFLKELEKLTGKGGNNPQERERERESNYRAELQN